MCRTSHFDDLCLKSQHLVIVRYEFAEGVFKTCMIIIYNVIGRFHFFLINSNNSIIHYVIHF